MYQSEELFVDKFIASLRDKKVTSIPFDNEDFYNGVMSMKQYFNTNRNHLGEHQNELAMLFIKSPLEDTFPEFRNAILKLNGWYLSFENPAYVVANIKLDRDGASYILNQNDLDIDKEHLKNFAEKFCEGAGVRP
ncbi:MAG: hypothetical protein ACYCX2_02295 [Christensenellales bacterium]